jgi:ferredoxin-NADP reductase
VLPCRLATAADILTLPVRDVLPATPRTRLLRLALRDRVFAYRAGQAVLLGLQGQADRKPYSIASAPEETARSGVLEFLVQIPGPESVSRLARLREGSMVDVEGPLGAFVFPDDPPVHRFLFVAGGTGIAPLRAMIRHALLTREGARISLLYSARSREEFAYQAELRGLASEGRLQLHETVTREAGEDWTGERGRITRAHLEPLLADPGTLCFLCGPPGLTTRAAALLDEMGVASTEIRTESWG